MKRSDVLKILVNHQKQLKQRFGVKSLALFGSVARDEAADASDVDLLVEFDRPIGLFHLIGTQQHIEGILGVARVDLVLRGSVIDDLKEDIFREAIDVFTPEVEVSSPSHPAGNR